MKLFKEIYLERGGRSEMTGKKLPFSVDIFAHVLAKKPYPGFRLYKKNIVIMERRFHDQYDHGSTIHLPEFKWIWVLKDVLKGEYYTYKHLNGIK